MKNVLKFNHVNKWYQTFVVLFGYSIQDIRGLHCDDPSALCSCKSTFPCHAIPWCKGVQDAMYIYATSVPRKVKE